MDSHHKGTYWGQYATVYDDGVDYVVGRELRLAAVTKLSHERRLGEVLECGCGTGFYTKVIALHADRVTATDISEEMLGIAVRQLASYPNVRLQKADAEKMPFHSLAFDTVLLANILNTVEHPEQVVKECFRVLRYGGLLIAIAYTDDGMEGEERNALGLRYFQKFGMPPSWGLNNFSPDNLRSLVSQGGFRVKSVAALGKEPKALFLRAVKSIPIMPLSH
ncbi:MAG: 2-methoxy-6-polyprenyl-1,4-benzoquinol methylase, mitochondrial [Syntrophus sp. SKADARSKE-3]|nr:2-methoxy-6-polyprenyl-1,4-benzoquinol methylase, mitochondrial [Syntrophus sp. SKADARSKE-3]